MDIVAPSQISATPDESDIKFQTLVLGEVSRTFALTIPQLPAALRHVVSNGYLLCRIVDTIEDEPTLSPVQKRRFAMRFADLIHSGDSARQFAWDLLPLLSDATTPGEQGLIAEADRVVGITHSLSGTQREALETCVRTMARGMAEFQMRQSPAGLPQMRDLDRYCYFVAGVVGEMLTTLFCDYSPAIAAQRKALDELAVSFGQGLQMTNILKDIWDDRERGACWLPRDVFLENGFDLHDLEPGNYRPGFGRGLADLIAIAYGHLNDALRYTLLIPREETGIRNFCLWAIGMAELTLRKINRHRDFTSAREVKISRRSVKAAIAAAGSAVGRDNVLRVLFYLAGVGLPHRRSVLTAGRAG